MTDKTEALPPLPEPSAYEVFAYGRRERLVSRADVADELACKYRENDPTADFSGLYTAKQVREAQRAALAQRQQVPEGWQLVPVEPTPQMERAAFDELELPGTPTENGTSMRNRVYRAMLAAAPALTAAPSAQAERRVYLVATGEIHEGKETYTRHDDSPPPLCDAECLYAAPPAAQAEPQPKGYVKNCHIEARDDEPLFVQRADGAMVAQLDGYRITPQEGK